MSITFMVVFPVKYLGTALELPKMLLTPLQVREVRQFSHAAS